MKIHEDWVKFSLRRRSLNPSLNLMRNLKMSLKTSLKLILIFSSFSFSSVFPLPLNLCLEDLTSMSVITQIPFSIFSSSSVAFLVLISSLIFVFFSPIRISSVSSRFSSFHVQVHRVVIRYPRILKSIHLIYPLIVLKILLHHRMTHHRLLILHHRHY